MRKLIIIMLLTIGVLFSGCSVPGLGGDTKTDGLFGGSSSGSSSSSSDTNGVQLTFSDGNPPKEMYNDQPVTFGFVFTNHQQHEITDLKMKVSGFDKSYVSGLSETYSVSSIPKATEQAGNGVYAGLIANNVEVKDFSQEYNFNPKFDYCYSAKSTLVEQICVPSKSNNNCEVDVNKMHQSNGPLVASVDSIVNNDNSVRIFFTVNNKGDGNVVNTCFKEEYANEYSIKATLGTKSGNCKTVSGDFNVINGEAKFYCDFTRSSDDSYATQISAELNYKYEQSSKLEILVKSLESN